MTIKKISDIFPTLERPDRVKLVERLQAESTWSADFVLMLGFSSAIAGLGLLQNSTAIIIGAMLVAPLMIPLLAAGLALVQANLQLFSNAMISMGLGVFTSVAITAVIGFLTPLWDTTLAMVARGSPNLLDLFVAFFGGAAAAYAVSRPNLSGALPGVAISAALVPPLATVGIALVKGHFALAAGAMILFITNLVAIIIGAAFIFWCLRFQTSWAGSQVSPWVRKTLLGLILMAVLLSAPLGYRLSMDLVKGEARPLAFPVSKPVFSAVEQKIAKEGGIELVLIGRGGVERGVDVKVVLASQKEIRQGFVSELKQLIRSFIGEKTEILVHVLMSPPLGQESDLGTKEEIE